MKRVLVVDDSTFSRVFLKKCLENLGMHVVEAVDGEAGIAIAAASRFDLVVTDLNMPFMDGTVMLRTMRSLPGYAAVPFVVVTGESASDVVSSANDLGIKVWMTKPIQPHMFAKAISRAMEDVDEG